MKLREDAMQKVQSHKSFDAILDYQRSQMLSERAAVSTDFFKGFLKCFVPAIGVAFVMITIGMCLKQSSIFNAQASTATYLFASTSQNNR